MRSFTIGKARTWLMDGQNIMRWLEPILGLLLNTLILVDMFVTILYARMGTSLISYRLANRVWKFFCWISKPFGKKRGAILSFCGPVVLVVFVFIWMLGLTLGTALVIHPHLRTGIRATSGPTPTDFATALYAAGSSLSVVGSSNFAPQTSLFRLFTLMNSIIGSVLASLVVTYLLQVYNTLHARNALGLKVYLLSAETSDAAEILAGLGPQGMFDAGYTNLADLAAEVVNVKESHHFYSVLFYFRFSESFYSVSHFTLVCFDLVTLMKSALDDEQYAWLKEAVSVEQIWRASMMLVMSLADNFLPGGIPDAPDAPDDNTRQRWHQRYLVGLKRLQQAGIETIADEKSGFETYVSLRNRWDYLIRALAPLLAYEMDEIDPVGAHPNSALGRTDFRMRQHSIDDHP
jgi:hypothetical protein